MCLNFFRPSLIRSPLSLLHSSLLNKYLAPSTPSFAFSASDIAIMYKYITTELGRQMTCHVPRSSRVILPVLTPQSLAYFSHSPPLWKQIENMAEALYKHHYRTCLGVYACWVSWLQSEVDGICNYARNVGM